MKNKILTIALAILFANPVFSQVYNAPKDTLVVNKLADWGDKKFGLFMHWGIYSVPGIMESWTLSAEDYDWIPRDSTISYDDYKKWYFSLNKKFNPTKFNPDLWAEYAKRAGMKYVVFTTKHHDGFSMFDTKQSNYKITSSDVPFSSDPKANITKEIFNSFRNKDFMIGAYFSKPDWHSEYFWWSRFATPDRNSNYNTAKYPQRWNKFKQFTYNQIEELMTDYGKVDILWLDGGWVRPKSTITPEVIAWKNPIPEWDQDLDMKSIATMARAKQPGLIMVDRAIHGEYENYITPEQTVPKKALNQPWESCITIGDSWSWIPNDKYKSTNQLVHMLVDIVAKGGNLLLNVGPKGDGTFPDEAIDRLNGIGTWMDINGEAIYATKPIAPYKSENVCFTQNKAGAVYAIYLLKENEKISGKVKIKELPKKFKRVSLLGNRSKLNFKVEKGVLEINVPKSAAQLQHALVFKLD